MGGDEVLGRRGLAPQLGQDVADGELLRGVRYHGGGAETYSLVMRSKSGTIRQIASEHKFDNASEYAAVNFEPPYSRGGNGS